MKSLIQQKNDRKKNEKIIVVILAAAESVKEKPGSDFSGFTSNKSSLTNCYSLVRTESASLYERTEKNAVDYRRSFL